MAMIDVQSRRRVSMIRHIGELTQCGTDDCAGNYVAHCVAMIGLGGAARHRQADSRSSDHDIPQHCTAPLP
jgi:hypothetical protein